MNVYEATISSDMTWSQLFLYPPTKRNLLNAVKAADYHEDHRKRLTSVIEEMDEYELPSVKEWVDSVPNIMLRIEQRTLRENRVP
jgi:hypothetical protein